MRSLIVFICYNDMKTTIVQWVDHFDSQSRPWTRHWYPAPWRLTGALLIPHGINKVSVIISNVWSVVLTDCLSLCVSGDCCIKRRRQRCRHGGSRQMKEHRFSLFITFTICMSVSVCGCVHDPERELWVHTNACVHYERYLRFQAVVWTFCLLFIRFQ